MPHHTTLSSSITLLMKCVTLPATSPCELNFPEDQNQGIAMLIALSIIGILALVVALMAILSAMQDITDDY